MADNFMQAINMGLNLGHMVDSAKMQRVQMERMAQQMQMEAFDRQLKVADYQMKAQKAAREEAQYQGTQTLQKEFAPTTIREEVDFQPVTTEVPSTKRLLYEKVLGPERAQILIDSLGRGEKISDAFSHLKPEKVEKETRIPNTTGVDAMGNPVRVPDVPGTIVFKPPGTETKEPTDDQRYRNIIANTTLQKPVSAEDAAWAKGYEKQKTLGADAYGRARLEIALTQPVPVVSKETGETDWVTKKDLAYNIGGARQKFMAMGPGAKAKAQTAIMEDIEGASSNARLSLGKLDKDFTVTQRAQIAYMLKSTEEGAVGKFLQSSVGLTLSPQQVDYLTDIVQLKENAYALRTILGAGQGSDELRRAIADTLPGALTPDRQYALTQLNKFDGQLARLKKAYFKINNEASGINIPSGAIDKLKKNPNLADAFDIKYGKGMSKQYLGGK